MAGAVEFQPETLSLVAAADLSAKQFYFVKVDSNGKADLPTASADRVIGVLQNKPKSGEVAEIRVLGGTKLAASGTISAGGEVMPHTDGTARAAATSGNTVRAIALEAAASGDIFSAMLVGPYKV